MAVGRRWLPSLVVVALLAGGIIRLAGWQGVWKPVRVSGASMATALVGEHHRLFCRDCQAICRYDAAEPPRDGRVICWNCGFVNNHTPDGPIFAGQRVLIDRFAYAWRKPNRWDVVAFATPDDPSRPAVKRIVGLPGERIEFRRGDLVADGHVVRKSLAQLRSLAVLVHDQAYQPRQEEKLPARWQSESPASRWHAAESRCDFETDGNREGFMDWLVYRHWPGYAGTAPRTRPSPILDNDSYNQQLSRRLNTVDDVLLSCWTRTPGQRGRLAYEVASRHGRCRVELRFDTREIAAFRDSHPLSRLSLPRFAFARGVLVEVALCDGQLLFGIDGHELIREAIDEGVPDSAGTAAEFENTTADSNASRPQIAVGAAGVAVTIERLQVYRDIYYLPAAIPTDALGASEPLEPNELFVIGDNVPVSHDSRHWPQPGVPIDRLLGRVWWPGSL
ncbi:MAG: signal peptidase I [Pirellulaceae bacterium]|nr:signal peptidase I [Pirellulaceae bacterium]